MKNFIFTLLFAIGSVFSLPLASAGVLDWAGDALGGVFGGSGIDVNNVDTECMIDLLNDRFGIDAGTPFKILGKGTEYLGKGMDMVGLGGEETTQTIGKSISGFGDNMSDVDLNDMDLNDVMNILNPSNKPVFDGPGLRRGARIIRCNIDRGVSTEEDLNVLALGWVNFMLQIVAVLAVVAIIYAGFLYIVSGGNDTEKAKKIVIYVAVGIILILASFAIVNTFIEEPRGGGGDEIGQNIPASASFKNIS